MPKIPDGLKEEFLAQYPGAAAEKVDAAVEGRYGVIQSIDRLRNVYAFYLLENGGHTAEPEVRQVFPEDGGELIKKYYEDEDEDNF